MAPKASRESRLKVPEPPRTQLELPSSRLAPVASSSEQLTEEARRISASSVNIKYLSLINFQTVVGDGLGAHVYGFIQLSMTEENKAKEASKVRDLVFP